MVLITLYAKQKRRHRCTEMYRKGDTDVQMYTDVQMFI